MEEALSNERNVSMRKIYSIFVFIILGFVSSQALAQPNLEGDLIIIPVADSVYMLESEGSGNIGVLIGEDGILIVDDKFAPLVDKIHQSLNEIGGGEIKFILNTHWHGDHTGGNEALGAEGTIIAHDNVRKRLSKKQTIELFNMVSEPHPKVALPVITFDESLTIHFNGEEIKVIHFANGHTDGDSVVFFTNSNVVHMGDHFFNGMYPFIDLESGGNVQGFTDNVEKLITLIPEDAKIIPGHGALGNLNDLKKFHSMLVETSSIVKTAINAKKSLEEIKKEGFDESIVAEWGQGILKTDQWIEIIYNSFAK